MPSAFLAAVALAAIGCSFGTEPEGETESEFPDEIAIHLTVETASEPRLVRRRPATLERFAAVEAVPEPEDAVMCTLE